MNVFNLKGIEEVESKLGPCKQTDFQEIRVLSVETYYEEDHEKFEKSLLLVLRGPKGLVEFEFQNVQDFKVSTLEKLGTFEVLDIRDKQLEHKNYLFFDKATENIFGYAELATISICENKYV